jgi:hypothetical protein
LVIKIFDLALLFSTTSLETREEFFVVFLLPHDGVVYALSGADNSSFDGCKCSLNSSVSSLLTVSGIGGETLAGVPSASDVIGAKQRSQNSRILGTSKR